MLDKDVVSGLRTTPNLRQDIEVQNVAGIMDKVVLNQPLNGLANHFHAHNEKYDAERLIGMEVISLKGTAIGTVEDLMIEHKTWKVPSIRVKVNPDEREALKMKSITLAGKVIDISMGNVRDIGDMVVLNMSADHLNDILEAPPIRKN
jgi:sporulation protein YlmC with PRC-barrel domain